MADLIGTFWDFICPSTLTVLEKVIKLLLQNFNRLMPEGLFLVLTNQVSNQHLKLHWVLLKIPVLIKNKTEEFSKCSSDKK